MAEATADPPLEEGQPLVNHFFALNIDGAGMNPNPAGQGAANAAAAAGNAANGEVVAQQELPRLNEPYPDQVPPPEDP